MAERNSLTTKRLVIGHVLVCQGCCCGAVERGRPEVPAEWLKAEWRRRGLLKRLQLSISGCLGPCDVPNVVVIASETSSQWFGNIAGRDMYRDILDWASASVTANRLLDPPKSFAGHSIEPFRKDVRA
jgi:predicted metal-binding protein